MTLGLNRDDRLDHWRDWQHSWGDGRRILLGDRGEFGDMENPGRMERYDFLCRPDSLSVVSPRRNFWREGGAGEGVGGL